MKHDVAPSSTGAFITERNYINLSQTLVQPRPEDLSLEYSLVCGFYFDLDVLVFHNS